MASAVLVADDSRVMRRIIIRALNDIGLDQIVEANDGDEALAEFGKQEFMLVLTDWNMPNKNGLEVIQGIRATGSKVPIIMVTTESEKARVFSAIEAGVTDYLIKPFDAETLRGKVEKHVAMPAS
ncbi:MAG: response regulator [Planctomycetaceae bacterium]|nr:response regulator [Planctomycetaceae bacterium]